MSAIQKKDPNFAAASGGQDFSQAIANQAQNHATEVDIARSSKEVESQVVMAKKFPRNEHDCYAKLMNTCSRNKFAATATYSYPRGGQKVEGPSIRLAEAAARAWGNMQFGIREITRVKGRSVVEAFAWDLESNVRSNIEFTVEHVRDTKGGGKPLTSERDIYEIIANYGARRLRKCILELIPEDVIEDALEHCNKAMHSKIGDIKEKIRTMTSKFKELGIQPDHLEKRLGNKLSACTVTQIVGLSKIYTSLVEGMSEASDWFDLEIKIVPEKKIELEDKEAIESAKQKLISLSQKAQESLDSKVYNAEMKKIKLDDLKSVRNGVDRLQTLISDKK